MKLNSINRLRQITRNVIKIKVNIARFISCQMQQRKCELSKDIPVVNLTQFDFMDAKIDLQVFDYIALHWLREQSLGMRDNWIDDQALFWNVKIK